MKYATPALYAALFGGFASATQFCKKDLLFISLESNELCKGADGSAAATEAVVGVALKGPTKCGTLECTAVDGDTPKEITKFVTAKKLKTIDATGLTCKNGLVVKKMTDDVPIYNKLHYKLKLKLGTEEKDNQEFDGPADETTIDASGMTIGEAVECGKKVEPSSCPKDWFACGNPMYTTIAYILIVGVIGGVAAVVLMGGGDDDDKDSDE